MEKIKQEHYFDIAYKDIKKDYLERKARLASLNKTYKKALSDLTPYKTELAKFTNVNKNKIEFIENMAEVKFSAELSQEVVDSLFILIKKAFTISKEIRELKELQKSVTLLRPYQFGFILERVNEKIMDKMIYEGYHFNMRRGLGKLLIEDRRERNIKPYVDWEASRINKQRIIDEGGTPYEVIERDVSGKAIVDNGGEKYIVYKDVSEIPFISWRGKVRSVANIINYRFVPTQNSSRDSEGNITKPCFVKKIAEAVQQDPTLFDKYTKYQEFNNE